LIAIVRLPTLLLQSKSNVGILILPLLNLFKGKSGFKTTWTPGITHTVCFFTNKHHCCVFWN